MTAAKELVVNVFDEDFQRNPYDVLAEARTQARCARDPFGSLILPRADAFEAIASDQRFGAFGDRLARMLGMESGPAYDWLSGSLMFLDPPDHTRLRGFVRKEFTPRRVEPDTHRPPSRYGVPRLRRGVDPRATAQASRRSGQRTDSRRMRRAAHF
jgi:cytochrome P450